MKTKVEIIKKLAQMEVFDTESVVHKKEDDIIIRDSFGENRRVVIDNLTDDDVKFLIAAEQLRTIKSIKSMVKYFVVCSIISIAV